MAMCNCACLRPHQQINIDRLFRSVATRHLTIHHTHRYDINVDCYRFENQNESKT